MPVQWMLSPPTRGSVAEEERSQLREVLSPLTAVETQPVMHHTQHTKLTQVRSEQRNSSRMDLLGSVRASLPRSASEHLGSTQSLTTP